MGKHSRSHQEKQTTRRRNRNVVGGAVAALTLAGAALVVHDQRQGDVGTKAPHDVATLVEGVAKQTNDNALLDVLKQEYREVASRQVGDVRVRIAEVGEAQEGIDYEKLLDVYQSLNAFLKSQPAEGLHEVISYDSNDVIVEDLSVSVRPKPLDKDITVLAVPANVDIGSYDGVPDVFTSMFGKEAVSFIRPNTPFAFEGAITEACQGMVAVEIANPEIIAAGKLETTTLLMQEQVCNSLSKAISASMNGENFDAFVLRQTEGSRDMHTDRVVGGEGSVGYVSMMPHLADPTVYESLGNGVIPSYFEQSLEFPEISTTG